MEWRYPFPYFNVECKPTMGDDYPAVLRQVQNLGWNGSIDIARIVLVGQYTGRAVAFEQVRRIFALSDIKLMLVVEVEDRLAALSAAAP